VEYQPQLPLTGDVVRRVPRADADSDWRLDEPTRIVGRQGLAAARAALASTSSDLPAQHADAA
jgi:hypothetical protein